MSQSIAHHVPCDKCDSPDAAEHYDDGHAYCYSCKAHWQLDGSESGKPSLAEHVAELVDYIIPDGLPARAIKAKTCWKWNYGVSLDKRHHVANHMRDGKVVAQKVRDAQKNMWVNGTVPGLYGEWLWRLGGKILVITEGELDALSVSQANDLRYPVVSIPLGAAGAAKAILASLEFVESYERVVFMFDMDEAGQAAAIECAGLLTPGKAAIAFLPMKDANELLVCGRAHDIVDAMWNAKPYAPDGIMSEEEMWEAIDKYDTEPMCRLPYAKLDVMTKGVRAGEMIIVCGAINSGKSTLCKEMNASFTEQGIRVGVMSLEEPFAQYMMGLASIRLNRHLGLEDGTPMKEEDFREAAKHYMDRCTFYADAGQRDSTAIFERIKYMKLALGVQVVILDHLTIVVGGAQEANDRRFADQMMTSMESLVKRTGVTIVIVMHLKKAGDGKAHEEGRVVSMKDIRGSQMIPALSHTIIAFERDQQGDEPELGTLRLIRCRWTGKSGYAGTLKYHTDTGRLLDHEVVDRMDPLPDTEGPPAF